MRAAHPAAGGRVVQLRAARGPGGKKFVLRLRVALPAPRLPARLSGRARRARNGETGFRATTTRKPASNEGTKGCFSPSTSRAKGPKRRRHLFNLAITACCTRHNFRHRRTRPAGGSEYLTTRCRPCAGPPLSGHHRRGCLRCGSARSRPARGRTGATARPLLPRSSRTQRTRNLYRRQAPGSTRRQSVHGPRFSPGAVRRARNGETGFRATTTRKPASNEGTKGCFSLSTSRAKRHGTEKLFKNPFISIYYIQIAPSCHRAAGAGRGIESLTTRLRTPPGPTPAPGPGAAQWPAKPRTARPARRQAMAVQHGCTAQAARQGF
jgi:hypothetical protein